MTRRKIIAVSVVGLAVVVAIFAFATMNAAIATGYDMDQMTNMGPMLGGKMMHAWISLLAAITIFVVALRYLAGGKLAYPILLIGLGAASDALLGLFPPSGDHLSYMWLGSLIFSSTVVIGIIWMASVFGAFSKK